MSRQMLKSPWALPAARSDDTAERPGRAPRAALKPPRGAKAHRFVFAVPPSRCRDLQVFVDLQSAKRRVATTADAAHEAAVRAAPDRPPQPRLAVSEGSIACVLRARNARVRAEFTRTLIRTGTARKTLYRLTLELLSGSPGDLSSLAARLAERFDLWQDPRPVRAIAQAVARGADSLPPVLATSVVLDRHMNAAAALGRMVGNCLEQILPNLAEVAAGTATAEHVHQARVGVRRLRAMLREFGAWSPGVDPAWEPTLAALFRRLGAQRDRDVLMETLLPAIRAAGGPPIRLAVADPGTGSAMHAARDRAAVAVLIALTAFSWTHADEASEVAMHEVDDLRDMAGAALKRLHARIRRDASRFAELNDEDRHDLRKRLKRLRYCVELAAGVCPEAAVKHFLAALRPVQSAIGEYTDLLLAESALAASAEQDPGAGFALGWLAARRPILLASTARALKRFAAVKWPC